MLTTIKVHAYYAVKSYKNSNGDGGAPGSPAVDPLLAFVSSTDEQW